jgi:trans-aconitate 2-methyltransferase
MQTWNPTQYDRFKHERSQPFIDLMKLVKGREQAQAVDLGCGTGELTSLLAEQFEIKGLLGIDNSKEMLEKAKAFVKPGLRFEFQSIESFEPKEKLDLLFSNAALQWTSNHETLFPKILSWVAKGGEFAIQMPSNFDHPSHRIAAEVGHELFPQKFPQNSVPIRTLNLERYAEILYSQGFHEQNCRIQIYGHTMASGRDVVQWTKGTLLTRYQAELTDVEFKQFLEKYEADLIAEIGTGPYFYAFKRMLLWGTKDGS